MTKRRQNKSGQLSDKKVAVPASASTKTARRPAKLKSGRGGDGRITVTHTEWLQKVTPTTVDEFEVIVEKNINPGLPGSFPWLSGIANNYESYAFKSLRFHYIPRCSSATPGTVMMLMDYDCLDAAPTLEQEIMNSHRATSGPAWQEQTLVCDLADLLKWPQRYTRKGEHPVQDQKTYDVGKFLLCTSGAAALTAFGSIRIEYEVVLMTPQLRNPFGDISLAITQNSLTPAGPVGDPDTQFVGGGLDIRIVSPTTLRFGSPGEYLLDQHYTGEAIVANPTLSVPHGLGLVDTFVNLIGAGAGASHMVSKVITLEPNVIGTFTAANAVNLAALYLKAAPFSYKL